MPPQLRGEQWRGGGYGAGRACAHHAGAGRPRADVCRRPLALGGVSGLCELIMGFIALGPRMNGVQPEAYFRNQPRSVLYFIIFYYILLYFILLYFILFLFCGRWCLPSSACPRYLIFQTPWRAGVVTGGRRRHWRWKTGVCARRTTCSSTRWRSCSTWWAALLGSGDPVCCPHVPAI